MNSATGRPAVSDRPPGNPFATRFTRPGAIPPLDHRGQPLDLAPLVARLRDLGTASITGGHGHGKTTLLLAIADSLAAGGSVVRVLRVRGWSDAFAAWHAIRAAPSGSLVCVDGWDGLGPARRPLAAAARSFERLLLVTSHRPAGLPLLRNCDTTAGLLAAIVARLPVAEDRVTADEVAAAFRRAGGNLRDALSDLYDRYERAVATARRPAGG